MAFFVIAAQKEGLLSGEEKDDEGHDGIDRSYNGFFSMSANEIAGLPSALRLCKTLNSVGHMSQAGSFPH